MAVVGERLDHVGAGAHELAVELAHRLGGVEHDLRHVGAGLEVAAPLQLEQIALGADHRPRLEPGDDHSHVVLQAGHIVDEPLQLPSDEGEVDFRHSLSPDERAHK